MYTYAYLYKYNYEILKTVLKRINNEKTSFKT